MTNDEYTKELIDAHHMEDDDCDLVIRFFEENKAVEKLANQLGIDIYAEDLGEDKNHDQDNIHAGVWMFVPPAFLYSIGICGVHLIRRNKEIVEVCIWHNGKIDDFDKMMSIAKGVTSLFRVNYDFHFPIIKTAHPSESFDDL